MAPVCPVPKPGTGCHPCSPNPSRRPPDPSQPASKLAEGLSCPNYASGPDQRVALVLSPLGWAEPTTPHPTLTSKRAQACSQELFWKPADLGSPRHPLTTHTSVAGRARELRASRREWRGRSPRAQGDVTVRCSGSQRPITGRRPVSPPICTFKLGIREGPGPGVMFNWQSRGWPGDRWQWFWMSDKAQLRG